MDVEVAAAIAPKAKIVIYFSRNGSTTEFLEAVRAAVFDKTHQLSVLLIDWGLGEHQLVPADMLALNAALQQGAQSGITIVAPAGESGASDGGDEVGVSFPASSPWVMAVGGTKLVSNKDAILSEVVWNDGSGGGASGGGVSMSFGLPDWESGVNAPRRPDGKPGRFIPDVVANASPATGYKLVIGGKAAVVGGTSGAAPLWAGLVALIDQGLGRRIGHINPYLYRIAGPRGTFRDIDSGNNSYKGVRGYSAGKGWDAASGWGSPNGRELLDALKAARSKTN